MPSAPDRLTAALADRYRIERELGAGGMANVYLAQDLRHDRRVALKVLKPELAAVVGAERFLAEIKTTANLQHPHILALFDSGQVDGTVFYVMPFVEGESLRDRLSREKQLPIDAALAIAREVGDALEYAHERGVIHRDIKPENILLHGGHALVADFGIALAASVTGGSRMTETGMSLGTPAYMSPEQAMGERTLDARTDVYALGCVLYEMLTGDPPFTASTAQAIVAKVLTERPAPIVARRERVPEHVEEAVLTALEKLPADRFATAAEFIAALAGDGGLARATSTRSGARHAGALNRGRGAWRAATGVLALVSLALATALGLRPTGTAASPPVRFEVHVGEPVAALPIAIAGAPDGSSYVYCSSTGAVVLRRWEALAPAPFTGPLLGCVAAAYSPDSRFVAVIGIPSSLQIFSIAGDVPRRELGIGKFGDMGIAGGYLDWGADDALYLASPAGVLRVSVADGTSRIVVAADSARTFYAVDVLPGERHALVVTAATAGANVGDMRVGVLDLRTGTINSLESGVIARFAAPDRAVIVRRDGSIAVRGFDAESRQFTGPATVLPDSMAVWPFSGFWQGSLDVAGDGSLYYVRSGFRGSTPALVDRSGRATQVAEGWTEGFIIPRLSPDGTRMSVELGDVSGTRAVLRDLRTGATRSLGAPAGPGRMSWHPDGSAMSVIADHEGIPSLYRWRVADDVAIPEPRYDPRGIYAAEWSRDGRWLVLRTDDQAAGRADILAVRPGIDSAARPVVATAQFSEYAPTLSPDARWMAYVSNEGGRYEVRVTDFPGGREKWQISSAGGSEPVWSADGRELFYVADDGSLMAASVTIVPEFRVLGQRRLFSTEPFAMYGVWNRNYDVSRDGQRFLMLQRPAEATSSVVVVQRWRSLLFPSDG